MRPFVWPVVCIALGLLMCWKSWDAAANHTPLFDSVWFFVFGFTGPALLVIWVWRLVLTIRILRLQGDMSDEANETRQRLVRLFTVPGSGLDVLSCVLGGAYFAFLWLVVSR